MATQRRDTEAHQKAAEKITFEKELCGDFVNKYLTRVPEERRADVRHALDDMMIGLANLWCRSPQLSDEWKRDRRALLRLIRSAFDRWADGGFVRRLVAHQLATNPKNTPKDITSYIEEKGIGIGKPAKTLKLIEARRNADRQALSRDSRAFRVSKKSVKL
jgi:hypothetical protein